MGRHGENIRKRKDGRWEGRYKVFDQNKGKNTYRSVYGRSYGEVKEKVSKARLGLLCQTPESGSQDTADSPVLFSQAAGEWLEEIADKRKYSTYIKYSTVYKTHLAESIGPCLLSSAVISEFQAKISAHLSEKTGSESLRKSICCIVNQILKYANKQYGLGIPLLENPSVKTKKKPVWTFSRDEQARLFGHIYSGLDKSTVAVLLCLYTGLRLGELCALRWADLDLENRTLTVNRTVQRVAAQGYMTKTILMETDPKSESSERTIPLTAEITELLARFEKDSSYVFGGEKPLDPRTMQYRFKKILKAAEINDRNFHLLRHTFATNCVENHMDVKTLSEILGHSDVKITLNRYVHPTMESKRKQLGALPDFYGQICGQVA